MYTYIQKSSTLNSQYQKDECEDLNVSEPTYLAIVSPDDKRLTGWTISNDAS